MAAKLLHSFFLCSDINLKSLIGLSLDGDDHLLITCKSFVKRYNIHSRTQVNSWITNSWHPFSTAAVKDQVSEKIVCIINKNLICQWKVEETRIESIKKHTVKAPVNRLLVHNNIVYTIYDSGFVETVEKAIKLRKEQKLQLLPISDSMPDEITECSIIDNNGNPILVLVTNNKEGQTLCHTYNISSNTDKVSSTQLYLNDHLLMGLCITDSGKLLSFWNDGNLYSLNIATLQTSLNPGTLQGRLDFIKNNKKVRLCQLPPNHIAIVGMDINEEGGMVALWDTKFGVKVSMKPTKMYMNPPHAWALPSGIVAVDGGALVHIPVSLTSSTVASMLACRPPEVNTVSNTTEWKVFDGCNVLSNCSSTELSKIITQISNPSQSDDIILTRVVNHLIEKKNTTLLCECLSVFEIFPEHCLVAVLVYFLNLEQTSCGDKLLSEEKERLVNYVLSHSFNQEELSDALRVLSFDLSWLFIQYLYSILSSGKATLIEHIESKDALPIVRVCTWLCLMIDTNYHQLVLTSEPIIHEKLKQMLQYVASIRNFLEASQSIGALADRVMFDQEMPTSQANASYSIEWINIQ